jgi:hypothetical protein
MVYFISSMKAVSGGLCLTTYLLGQQCPITFANGKGKAFGRRYNKHYAHASEKSKDETLNERAAIIDSQSVKTGEKRGKCTVTTEENKSKVVSGIYW